MGVDNNNRFARNSQGCGDIAVEPSERPFSNFEFVDKHFHGWDPLRRIFSQTRKLGSKTIVREKIENADDISEENEDLKKYKGLKSSETYRIGFFKKKFIQTLYLETLKNEDFLGYVIVKKDKFARKELVHVFESVIKTSRHENNFVRGNQTWSCKIGDIEFQVDGYLYAQQNGLTKVCAHVAARTVAACYHKNGDMTYREMNQVIGINHIDRKLGNGQYVNSEELLTVIEEAGANCFFADYTKNKLKAKKLPFQKVLYGSIESGFPAIIVFDTRKTNEQHAIPVFGHTFNEDTWACYADQAYFEIGKNKKFIPSETWLSTFIAHDDNFGSNFCIPQQYLHTAKDCDAVDKKCPIDKRCIFEKGCVAQVIATRPNAVETNHVAAELMGFDYLEIFIKEILDPKSDRYKQYSYFDEYWREKLAEYWVKNKKTGKNKKNKLVLRTILIRAYDYPEHLWKVRDWNGKKIKVGLIANDVDFGSDQWLWMVELSVPELFSANKRKLGEIIIKAQKEPDTNRDFSSFIMARIPGYFITLNHQNEAFEFRPSESNSHVELYGCEEN